MNYLESKKDYLIIVGTARESRNTIKPAKAVDQEFQDQGHETIFYDLKEKDIPPLGNRTYSEDEEPVPEDIQDLKSGVEDSDGIIIIFPEYNHSVPGVMKNALDYLYPEYDGKPFGFVSVSAGGFGGVRALNHAHEIVLEIGGKVGPELPVSNVVNKFNEEGELKSGEFEEKVCDFVGRFSNFVDSERCIDREKLEKVRKLYKDVWSGENIDSVNEIIHDKYQIHHADFSDDKRGPEKVRELAEKMFEAFPDMKTEINEVVPNSDKIAVRWTMKGTHKGSRYGEEPTQKEVEMEGMEFLEFEDGKIKEHNALSDTLGLKKQIGLI